MLASLWLPIIISGVVVYIASSISWMVMPHHKSDWKGVPDEDAFAKAMRELKIPEGHYMFPCHHYSGDMNSEEFKKRWEEGPTGIMSIWSGPMTMGRNMACTFLFYMSVNFVLAYLSGIAFDPGEEFMQVFRFVSTAGLLAYCAAGIPSAIWFRHRIVTNLMDGFVYALLTGLVFALMWPAAG